MNIAIALMATRSASALSALPAASQCRVAVCGAGVAGALTARRLAEAGMSVTCFEAGRGPRGRTSSRRTDLGHFDHGASYFSPKTEGFAKTVEEWVAAGAAAEWRGRFGTSAIPMWDYYVKRWRNAPLFEPIFAVPAATQTAAPSIKN